VIHHFEWSGCGVSGDGSDDDVMSDDADLLSGITFYEIGDARFDARVDLCDR